MAKRIGAGREERSSALWGTTKRDGDSRGSALWGGGRGRALLLATIAALALPLAAGAGSGPDSNSGPGSDSGSGHATASGSTVLIPDALLEQAKANPTDTFRVIVQGVADQDAKDVASSVARISARYDRRAGLSAKHAEDAATKARSVAEWLTLKAQKLKQVADEAKAEADTKAAAAAGGKPSARKEARRAADRAARKAAEAAKIAQDAARARAAAGLAAEDAEEAQADVSGLADTILERQITDRFDAISGVAAGLTGEQIAGLAASEDDTLVSITPDQPVVATGPPAGAGNSKKWTSDQAWLAATGADANWTGQDDPAIRASMPAIAIVDSGIESRADFEGRIVASVNLSSLPNNSRGDGRGHGTFVAGVAAGAGPRYAGVAPAAKLVSIDVLDDNGMGLTSDVIRACQWILDNRDRYDIRVANFSLRSQITAPFYLDPLDRAVERLWFNGVVVVAAVGNYGKPNGPSGVLYSPANDPFVITVGAADLGEETRSPGDDTVAPWSAWGPTIDGFMKPELAAPGRYMVAPVPVDSTLVAERPESVVEPGYMQLSGTSFAAPVVSGAAADILARHPEFTPDQVKGALMLTAQPMERSVGHAGGVGVVALDKAMLVTDPPNPNAGLAGFVKRYRGFGYAFDAFSWVRTARANASWNSASWNSASWNSASWNSASWNSASWNSASWNSASWNSASWNSASWNSASWNSASWNSASWNSNARDDAVDRTG
jgi:serine protease AprX